MYRESTRKVKRKNLGSSGKVLKRYRKCSCMVLEWYQYHLCYTSVTLMCCNNPVTHLKHNFTSLIHPCNAPMEPILHPCNTPYHPGNTPFTSMHHFSNKYIPLHLICPPEWLWLHKATQVPPSSRTPQRNIQMPPTSSPGQYSRLQDLYTEN